MKFKGKKHHGNSLKNEELHHLYEVVDDVKQSTFKYGISADPFLRLRLRLRLIEMRNV